MIDSHHLNFYCYPEMNKKATKKPKIDLQSADTNVEIKN
jgi:hypothetical protein